MHWKPELAVRELVDRYQREVLRPFPNRLLTGPVTNWNWRQGKIQNVDRKSTS
jgi:hypothetical protein